VLPWRFATENRSGDNDVAHSLSAKKRIRQTVKRNARNRFRKELLKGDIKSFTAAIAAHDATKAAAELQKVVQRLDKISAKGTIHRNTAARKRSRLTLRLNALRAGVKTEKAVVGKAKPKAKAKAKPATA
jgi:small subunit ribosomal protein S20